MTENYFKPFRDNIIGINTFIETPYHKSIPIIYTDWTASGRMYKSIEDCLNNDFFPLVANTHTDTNTTGMATTYAYHKAKQIIKKHVNASNKDILISSNAGMTGVVNKFQRILGLKIHEKFKNQIDIKEKERPIVFISHMEHHSNQTSWLETIADVVAIPPNKEGVFCLENFQNILKEHKDRDTKIAAITSCSNVTGIMTPYYEVAKIMHKNNGLCFVDFACSAPYVEINMHKDDASGAYLDAIFFSPHKFLGGPGTTGILVFNQKLYNNTIPDNPGGGTVDWTNPWGEHKYIDDIETREDGGTPAFLQTIKTALCLQLKNKMGVENILKREKELLTIIWDDLEPIENLHILAPNQKNRLGVISFYIDNLHYNVAVKILNDRYGIQTRGGCSCAGTYGHFLLNVTQNTSKNISSQISSGNCSSKPGWIRMSIHPTHTNNEVKYVTHAIKELALNHVQWIKEYTIDLSIGKIKANKNDQTKLIESKINSVFSNSF